MNTDRRTIQIVIVMVGLIALTLAAGMLFLNASSMKIDPVLSTIAGSAVGALTAMLVSTKSSSANDQAAPVAVVNQDPIAVTDTAGKHDSAAEEVGVDLPTTDLTGA